MVRSFWRLVCVFFLVAPLMAGAQRYGDILVDVDDAAIAAQVALHGYRSLTVTVQNFGEQQRDVTLVFDNSNNGWEYLNYLERQVTLAAKASVKVHVPIEIRMNLPAELAVVIDGERQAVGIELPRSYGMRYLRANILSDQPIALPSDFTTHYADIPVDWTLFNNQTRNGESVSNFVKRVADWTDDWLDYTSYEQVWLELNSWNELSQAHKEALNTWVRNGGHLIIYGATNNLLDLWEASVVPSGDAIYTASVAFGLISVCPPYGELSGSDKIHFIEELSQAYLPWVIDSSFAPEQLGIQIDSEVHMRGFIIMLLIFALLLGPVNIYILFKRNKRMWLYATVPIFSILASVGIFTFSYFYYGSANQVHRYGLVFLDQVNKRANILGYDALYPMTSYSKGLNFPLNAEVDPMIENGNTQWRSLLIDQQQRFLKGWLPARTLSQFRYRFEEPRRERLLFERDGQALYVTNHLGAEIVQCLYRGSDGQHYISKNLPVGKRISLEPVTLGSDQRNPRKLYNTMWFARDFFEEVGRIEANGLQAEGSYLAVMESAPFSPETIEGANFVTHKTILIGQSGAL